MTQPSLSCTNLRDHGYLVLTDGSLFCVAGNQHTSTEVLGCLYYTPASAIDDWNLPSEHLHTLRPRTAPDGSACYKIGPIITREPAAFARPLNDRGVRWWPSTHLQAVARDRIAAVLDPVAELARTVRGRHSHSCPLGTLVRLADLAAAGGVPPNQIGLTGSASFNDTNICTVNDLDLILVHPVRFAMFARSVRDGWNPLAWLTSEDARRERYLAERLPSTMIGTAETRTVTARRLDVGWVDQVRVDLIEVIDRSDSVDQWPFDLSSLGIAEITGTVTEIGPGYPFNISLAECDHLIMITRRAWQGVLRPGDQVMVRGEVFADSARCLVIDNRRQHSLRLLGPRHPQTTLIHQKGILHEQ